MINVENGRKNYEVDRSSDFKHQVPSDMTLPSCPTVQEYVNQEKSKQMNKIRDWYLEAKDQSPDSLTVRCSFANSRKIAALHSVRKLNQPKRYLVGGTLIVAIISVIVHFGRF